MHLGQVCIIRLLKLALFLDHQLSFQGNLNKKSLLDDVTEILHIGFTQGSTSNQHRKHEHTCIFSRGLTLHSDLQSKICLAYIS